MLSYLASPATTQQVCGEATCMAFAFRLLDSRHRPEECPPLASSTSVAERQTLAEILAGVPETADRANLNTL
jgi:CO dehydrogenase/acetyl-CoA synthase gamma subunit (corrinoid Fe-S protein)